MVQSVSHFMAHKIYLKYDQQFWSLHSFVLFNVSMFVVKWNCFWEGGSGLVDNG